VKNLQSLVEELRALVVQEEPAPDLATLTSWTKQVLSEEGVPAGTKHKWADGKTYVKQRDGSWSPEPTKRVLALPATTTTTPKAAAPAAASGGTGGGERATADKLPDDPFKYFKKTPDAKLIPVSALATIRARPEGIANAAKHMANAFNGDGEKRKPISLKDNGDGTYTVMDGNSTTAMARQHKWKNIVATVEPADSKAAAPAHGPKGAKTDDEYGALSAEGKDPKTGEKRTVTFADAVKDGWLASGMTVAEHVQLAKKFLGEHAKSLDKSMADLKKFMPEGVKVKGRTKDVDSSLQKLVRKSKKYKSVDKLQDGTGMRVIAKDAETLDKSIEALKKNYKIIESDDYVTQPLEGDKGLGYRSFHAIIEGEDGLQKEIQLRTQSQDDHAEWCHDVYKPQRPEQDAAMKKHADTISDYARKMGDYFHKVDTKQKPPEPPECPPPVREYFTCL
jgi:ppGpp synthetase/RelA/SpoT-type nucleotidyltranferase